jgi:Ca2+-binding EF-hand superfamily protein
MTHYITCIFKVVLSGNNDVSLSQIEELADVTARDCFSNADTNADGKVSLSEFQVWFFKNVNNLSTTQQQKPSSPKGVTIHSLEHLKSISGLCYVGLNEVIDRFGTVADDKGEITFSSFKEVLFGFIPRDVSELDRSKVAHTLYSMFDSDHNGMVDFTELACGLIVLAGGDAAEKIAMAFQLFHVDEEDSMSVDEMISFLHSVFKLMYSVEKDRNTDLSPLQLATITARHCFKEFGKNVNSDRLTFREFSGWYHSHIEDTGSKEPVVPTIGVNAVRSTFGLDDVSVEQFVDKVKAAADNNGVRKYVTVK